MSKAKNKPPQSREYIDHKIPITGEWKTSHALREDAIRKSEIRGYNEACADWQEWIANCNIEGMLKELGMIFRGHREIIAERVRKLLLEGEQ